MGSFPRAKAALSPLWLHWLPGFLLWVHWSRHPWLSWRALVLRANLQVLNSKKHRNQESISLVSVLPHLPTPLTSWEAEWALVTTYWQILQPLLRALLVTRHFFLFLGACLSHLEAECLLGELRLRWLKRSGQNAEGGQSQRMPLTLSTLIWSRVQLKQVSTYCSSWLTSISRIPFSLCQYPRQRPPFIEESEVS